MVKHAIKITQRGINESIVRITFFPETDEEKSIVRRATEVSLNEKEHEYFNNMLISICLNNNLTPIAAVSAEGNSFFFRVLS